MNPNRSHAFRARVLLVCALFSAPVFAQPGVDPPIVGRPDDFSNIVGKYDIQASAEPTEVRVEEPITLHIRITGSGPQKYEPDRKHLHLFPAWGDDFYVQEMRDEHPVERDKKTWLFVYRLKPKHAKVDAIDGIKLVYYDPGIPSKKKFVTIPVESIKIIVKSKPPDPGPEISQVAPDSFYEHGASADVLARSSPPIEVTGAVLAIVLLGIPLGCFWCLLAVFWPTKNRLWSRQRNESAERALADLRAATEAPWNIMCRYLRERLNFAALDATPREAARFLKRRGFALERCAQIEAFLQASDVCRFTGGASDARLLTEEAATLIQSLEADPCLRG
jgi:hypothetical protein